MKRFIAYATAVLSLVLCAKADGDEYMGWNDAPLGIYITDCTVYKDCIHVSFVTDLEPPFVASVNFSAVHDIHSTYPIAEVETYTTNAIIPGSFLDESVYVSVETRANIRAHDAKTAILMRERAAEKGEILTQNYIDKFMHQVMGRASRLETSKYFQVGKPFVNTNANVNYEVVPRREDIMYLVDDHTWVGFRTSSESSTVFHMRGRKWNDETKDFEDFENELSMSGNPNVGKGYRIVFFDDTDTVLTSRAYSANTNVSNFVYFPRFVKSLSTCNGYRYTTNWLGAPYLQPSTNDPWIIHWEGIKD